MKKCDICKINPATIHLTQVINNKVQKLDLCEECAKNMGLFSSFFVTPTESFLSPFLKGLGDIFENVPVKKCSNCGLTWKEFQNSGKLGCFNCYNEFKNELFPLIKRLQGSTTHKGKSVVKKESKKEDLSFEIKKLEMELKKAVEKEEYEKAAVIRDKIKKLKSKK